MAAVVGIDMFWAGAIDLAALALWVGITGIPISFRFCKSGIGICVSFIP